jgi:hypothetical protein
MDRWENMETITAGAATIGRLSGANFSLRCQICSEQWLLESDRANKSGSLGTSQTQRKFRKHVQWITQSKVNQTTDGDNHESNRNHGTVTIWPPDLGRRQVIGMQRQATNLAAAIGT